MDAMLSDAPALSSASSITPPSARLPGEDDQLDSEVLRAPTPQGADPLTARPQKRLRKDGLMSTVGIVLLIGLVGAMGYMQRAELERIPVIGQALTGLHASSGHATGAAVADNAMPAGRAVQPQAHALGPLNARTGHIPGAPAKSAAKPAAAPAPAAPVHAVARAVGTGQAPAAPATKAKAPDAELAQFDAFKSGARVPASSAAPAPAAKVPASAPAPAALPLKVAISGAPTVERRPGGTAGSAAAVPSNAAPGQAAPQPPKSVPAPVDVAAQAVVLRAAPMTDREQLDVLHLVTQLDILVRDERTEIAGLRGQVSELSGNVNRQLTDFDRRLSIAEAKGAFAAAMSAGETTTPHVVAAPPPPAPAPPAGKVAEAAPAPIVRSVSDYRIQAASPGLAMLSTTVDGGSTIQVGVGGEVPGIGHVQAIFQRGTSWVVKTDHGVIQ